MQPVSCVTLERTLNFSKLRFPHLWNKGNHVIVLCQSSLCLTLAVENPNQVLLHCHSHHWHHLPCGLDCKYYRELLPCEDSERCCSVFRFCCWCHTLMLAAKSRRNKQAAGHWVAMFTCWVLRCPRSCTYRCLWATSEASLFSRCLGPAFQCDTRNSHAVTSVVALREPVLEEERDW